MVDMDLIILGMLLGGPAHGYQIKQNIVNSYGNRYFKLSNSALYPRLAKLEKEGLIEGRREPQEKVPDRKVYYITQPGIQKVKELAATPIKPSSDIGSEDFDFMLHAAFFGLITREERRKVIQPIYEDKCAQLKEAEEKRVKYGQYMDKFSLVVLDNGIEMLKLVKRFHERLMEMD